MRRDPQFRFGTFQSLVSHSLTRSVYPFVGPSVGAIGSTSGQMLFVIRGRAVKKSFIKIPIDADNVIKK